MQNAFEREAQQLAGQCGLELKKRGMLAETADAQAVAAVLEKWQTKGLEQGFSLGWTEAVRLSSSVRHRPASVARGTSRARRAADGGGGGGAPEPGGGGGAPNPGGGVVPINGLGFVAGTAATAAAASSAPDP